MKNSGNTAGILLGSLAAGVAIGMLLSPEKGSETRKKLISRLNKLKEQYLGADLTEFYANVHSASNPKTETGQQE
jgi:gas vesicle protein